MGRSRKCESVTIVSTMSLIWRNSSVFVQDISPNFQTTRLGNECRAYQWRFHIHTRSISVWIPDSEILIRWAIRRRLPWIRFEDLTRTRNKAIWRKGVGHFQWICFEPVKSRICRHHFMTTVTGFWKQTRNWQLCRQKILDFALVTDFPVSFDIASMRICEMRDYNDVIDPHRSINPFESVWFFSSNISLRVLTCAGFRVFLHSVQNGHWCLGDSSLSESVYEK